MPDCELVPSRRTHPLFQQAWQDPLPAFLSNNSAVSLPDGAPTLWQALRRTPVPCALLTLDTPDQPCCGSPVQQRCYNWTEVQFEVMHSAASTCICILPHTSQTFPCMIQSNPSSSSIPAAQSKDHMPAVHPAVPQSKHGMSRSFTQLPVRQSQCGSSTKHSGS